jgi:hypothetical protein
MIWFWNELFFVLFAYLFVSFCKFHLNNYDFDRSVVKMFRIVSAERKIKNLK